MGRVRSPLTGWAPGLLLLLCITGGPAAGATEPAGTEPPTGSGEVPVLAYYYAWFDPESWNRAKIDYPLLGRYSSDDRAVIEQHVRWAQDAGIDGFIVSWKNSEVLTRRLELMAEVAAVQEFKLAIVIQGLDVRRQPRPPQAIGADLDFFAGRYATNPVFDIFGRPLVIWSGTWEFSREEIASVTGPRRAYLFILATERNAGAYQSVADLFDGDAYYWSSVDPTTFPNYPEKLAGMAEVVRANDGLWIAPVAPGFDARLVGGTRIVDRVGGETLRQELVAALASEPDAVGLISWNEFSENTHVEPSCAYGTETLTVLAEALGGQAPSVPASLAACSAVEPTTLPASTAGDAPPEIEVAAFDEATPEDVLGFSQDDTARADVDSSSPGDTLVRPWNLLVLGGLAAATLVSLAVIGARGRREQTQSTADAPMTPGDAGIGAA